MDSILTFGHAGHSLSGHQPQLSMHQWTTLDLTAVAQYSEQHKTKQDIGSPGASVVVCGLYIGTLSVYLHMQNVVVITRGGRRLSTAPGRYELRVRQSQVGALSNFCQA